MRLGPCILTLVLAAPLAGAAAPASPRIDLEGGLDLTEGLARAGAYVPVRLAITNRTDFPFDQVRLESSGPVRVVAPLRLAPAATGATTVPAFYAGGDLVVRVECLAGGRVVAGAPLGSLKVTALGEDAALVGVEAGAPNPEAADLAALQAALQGRTPRFLALDADQMALVARCGLLDAALLGSAPAPPGDLVLVRRRPPGQAEVRPSPFPRGVRATVDPGAYRVFAAETWPAGDRARLWLGLGVFALAVLGAGLLVPRRRAAVALAVMVALGAVATAAVWRFGGVHGSRTATARVFYAAEGERAPAEWYAYLAWRGRSGASCPLPAGDYAWPVPVVRESGDWLRPLGTLVLGGEPRFEADRSGVLLRGLGEAVLPPRPLPQGAAAPLAEVAVESGSAEVLAPARKAAVPLGACAVEWKEAADSDLAYAGRSLAWWAAARQEGPGRFRLTWVRDVPAGGAGPVATMLPALIVVPGAP